MNDIDKYFAEKVGAGTADRGWTIKDPRCREKVREKFKIETHICADGFSSNTTGSVSFIDGYGDSIEEAEIACCQAVYEANRG